MRNELSTLQEAELLQQLQMGNEHAFELLMNRYYKSLYSYAAKFSLEKEAIKGLCARNFFKPLAKKGNGRHYFIA